MSFWGHDAVVTIDADRRGARSRQSGAQLIDVGEPDDWFAGHLPHAILVEPELLDQEMHKLSKDKPVVVASRNNELSESVAASLHNHGFDVAMIKGGVSAWKAAGHKLVKADGTQGLTLRTRGRRTGPALAFAAVAQNPNPLLPITSYAGVTRTLDDWATVFNIMLIVLPDRPEGAGFIPVVDRIFATFGDSDVRTVICVPSTEGDHQAHPRQRRRPVADLVAIPTARSSTASVSSAFPSFLMLRQDTQLIYRGTGLEPDGMAEDGRRDRAERALVDTHQ